MINTFSPSDVTFQIDGYTISAWETIELSKDTESYNFIKGTRGKNTRVRNYNKSALLKISVLQTSDAHDILSEIHSLDIAQGESTADCARLSITLKDRSGTTAFQSDDAYIVSYPSVKFSQDFEMREWQIQCHTYNLFIVGGNIRPTTPALDSIFSALGF